MDVADPVRVAAAFASHGVDYVMVGGVATAAHGGPIALDDIDVVLPPNDENVTRVSLALLDLGAEALDADGEHRSTFATTAGRLDLIELPEGYREVAARAIRTDLGHGVLAPVAALEDLAQLKRDAGDLIDAARLTTIASAEAPPNEHDILSEPVPATGRIMRALERVDDFLTDLDSRGLKRRRDAPAA